MAFPCPGPASRVERLFAKVGVAPHTTIVSFFWPEPTNRLQDEIFVFSDTHTFMIEIGSQRTGSEALQMPYVRFRPQTVYFFSFLISKLNLNIPIFSLSLFSSRSRSRQCRQLGSHFLLLLRDHCFASFCATEWRPGTPPNPKHRLTLFRTISFGSRMETFGVAPNSLSAAPNSFPQ